MAIELPLFPLNVVLFPGMPLPLHIFEPRYRLMVRRCLEADRTFGVAMIAEGDEGESGTVPIEIGCSSEITEVAPLPDGRINLQTVGRRRFRILSTRQEDEYLIGTVEWLDDEPDFAQAHEAGQRVLSSLRRYLRELARNANVEDVAPANLDAPDDPYALSMWVAALIALPNPQKQELLEITSTLARLEREEFLLRRAEVVQVAFARRLKWLEAQPPTDEDGPYAQFLSLN